MVPRKLVTGWFDAEVANSTAVEGTHRRIAVAEKAVSEFGIGTECGFGRRAESTIADLLRIHAEVADG